MKFILTDYQQEATDEVLRGLRRATRAFAEDGEYGALVLSAPTAAGKTIIATAVIERLFYGDEVVAPDPLATVLWITDDPSLNEQTRRKMVMASSRLKTAQLQTIDAGFDSESFRPGIVFFLNIQKLGRATSYVRGGTDSRKHSLWSTIANTVRTTGGHFYIIIDEAHRGARADTTRPTIISRIITGDNGTFPPLPVVWGISATPERFETSISTHNGPTRVRRDIKVSPEDVRESGLLKDKILIKNPVGHEPSDATLTRLAVADLRDMHAQWATYTTNEDEPPVVPAMVIQMKASVSDAELALLLDTVRDAWPDLTGNAVAHTFETHAPLSVGRQVIRYIEPQDIQDDLNARVVLFKEALTTGWDCPRAEVMLSFRKARDYTYIAQLIGRMVRTPLAKRIVSNDVLNTVSLFLPYYDDRQVDTVIKRLHEDPDAPPTTIEKRSIPCRINATISQDVLDQLTALPTYIVPRRVRYSQVHRVRALATRLAGDSINEQAISVANRQLIATLDREKSRLQADGAFDAKVSSLAETMYRVKAVSLLRVDSVTSLTSTAETDPRNINDLLRKAARSLPDGLATTYWGHLVAAGMDADTAKLQTYVLAQDNNVVKAVESAAMDLVQLWLREFSREISSLSEVKKAAYYAIRGQAKHPEIAQIALPEVITASEDDARWPKHIYANNDGLFPAAFTTWEEGVLRAELGDDAAFVAWYRNAVGGERAIRVPYNGSDGFKPLYPDFVFFHKAGDGSIMPSIVDPHNYSLSDTLPKWRGLAQYAELHGSMFLRIDAVIQSEDGRLLRLDLKDPAIRAALEDAKPDAILQFFQRYGGKYS